MDKVVISIIIAVLVIAILATVLVIIFKKVDLKKAISQTAELPDNFTYTAHTGCVGTADNSLVLLPLWRL